MKRVLFLTFIMVFVGYSIYIESTTPEEYITTNIYDGYVKNDYFCSRYSSRFVDTKTGYTIILDHSWYLMGKYKLSNGDHVHIEQIITKGIDYRYTYKLKINDQTIDTYYKNVRIYKVIKT